MHNTQRPRTKQWVNWCVSLFRCESSPTWSAERWPSLKTPNGSPATIKVSSVCVFVRVFFCASMYWCMFKHVFSGYYTHISTLADVQENVMEYLHVLSRPMVINHDHDIIWTEAYMDTVVSRSSRSESLKEQFISHTRHRKCEIIHVGEQENLSLILWWTAPLIHLTVQLSSSSS